MTTLDDRGDEGIRDAFQRADEAVARGDLVEALHILRSCETGDRSPQFSGPDESGNISIVMPTGSLVLAARAAILSLMLGQWSDSPRHDPDSDSPHGWLTMYESLNPRLPEKDKSLRYGVGRLRVMVADDHGSYFKMAAWAHDIYQLCESDHVEAVAEALPNMAVAMSNLGFKGTARSLYLRALGDERAALSNRSALAIRYGDFLWSVDERTEAEEWYSTAIKGYLELSRPNVNDLHNLVRAYARRVDCFLEASQNEQAIADIEAAFRVVERARALGAYQSARSVDAAVVEDIKNLIYYLTSADLDASHARVVAGALSRLGNSSGASRLRVDSPRAGAHAEVYADTYRPSSARTAQIRSTRYWNEFTDADVDAVLASPTPLLMIAASGALQESQVAGVTLLVGAGADPVVKTWRLTAGADADDGRFELFSALLDPPPGVLASPDNVWAKPWDRQPFQRLAEALLPLSELTERLAAANRPSLRIVPAGALWRFPFGALAIGAEPLALTTPYVLAPGMMPNLASPRDLRWYGHFDLTLPNTVAELRETLAAARLSVIPFTLFNDVEDLPAEDEQDAVSHLLFSGHGQIRRGEQRLLLAGGRPCTAADLTGLASGATVLLNACWSGYVFDEFASDPAHQALELLAGGAHSVLGTFGPISDRDAGHFLRECLPALAAGEPLASAVRIATSALLEADKTRPLASWASYATIGRHTEFAVESEAARDR